jgi:hypothetical protein
MGKTLLKKSQFFLQKYIIFRNPPFWIFEKNFFLQKIDDKDASNAVEVLEIG